MKKIFIPAALLILASCAEQKEEVTQSPVAAFNAEGKTAVAYTTADSTQLRLTATDTLSFKEMGQPVETQVCIC